VTSRRDFLTSLAAAGGAASLGRQGAAPVVVTSTTVFYAHPDGETTLVRVAVHDADVPAGRIRIFDRRGAQLLGTAGVLGIGSRLFGELWLPLRGETRIISQLEMPGLSRPLRTLHDLVPHPQWTIHWITVVDPTEAVDLLARLPTWRRVAALATLRALQVAGNPMAPGPRPAATLDHMAFLRGARAAHRLAREFDIPVSTVAVGPAGELRLGASALALASVGIANAVTLDDDAGPVFRALRGPDESTITTAALPPRSTPVDLKFPEGGDAMAREVEEWLTGTPAFLSPFYGTNVALVVHRAVSDDLGRIAQAVADWNARYAYPRIRIGAAEDFFLEAKRVIGSGPGQPAPPAPQPPLPSDDEIDRCAAQRAEERATRLQQLVAPLNALTRSGIAGARGVAQHLDIAVDGTLVFNPSPVPRTDLVTMPDGSEQLATDIPALGYAYLIGRSASSPPPYEQLGTPSVFGQHLTVRLDPATGAISSVFNRSDGREWVRSGTPGLNAVRGAMLERVTRLRLPEIGMRLIARRRTQHGMLTTTVTGYETLPWIDIDNEIQDGTGSVQYDYHFAIDQVRVTRETPAGVDQAGTPLGPVPHLRWLRLEASDNWQVLLRGLDAPYAACDVNGRIVSLAPRRRSRYRVALASPYAPPDAPWHFGWSTEPLAVVAATPPAPSARRLPRFGRLIAVDEPGVMVLGLKAADDGDGAIVYLQELLGVSRTVRLGGEIIGFRGARLVDPLERFLERLPVTADPAVTLPLPANGIAVVRLLDLYLTRT
jgi:hypothetical protein